LGRKSKLKIPGKSQEEEEEEKKEENRQ